ncbi:MAG: type II toxin-antitoxin system prevent-host-death family antitoxin [Acidimicrobiales bacterium]|nr:type II toxin-antitoxin system prevent-host-death family antitoxin [Acidimicrobiales bacterium]
MTEQVGIRALQRNAAAVVARAGAGAVIEVTDHGRPVARLVPLENGALNTLVGAGLARPARLAPSELSTGGPRSSGADGAGTSRSSRPIRAPFSPSCFRKVSVVERLAM